MPAARRAAAGFARQKIDKNMLKELEHGDDEDARPRRRGRKGEDLVPVWWFYAVGAGLCVSLLLNLFLALRP